MKMENRDLFEWMKSQPDSPPNHALLLTYLESLATIDDDGIQKRFLKELIQGYVALEKRVDSLLKNTLPATVAEELKYESRYRPRAYNCTILFTDFIGFTRLTEVISGTVLIETLHTIFTEFDEQMAYFKGTKIKTIGDAYMAVFGAPIEYKDHPVRQLKRPVQ